MQMPKFTKITTGGHPAYRFDHDGKTFRAYRYASGAGAWNVDRIDGEQRTPVVRARDTRAAAVAAVIDAPKDEQPSKLDELAADLEQQNTDADELLADIRALGPEVDALEGEVAEWSAKVDALTDTAPAETRRPDELEHNDVVRIAGTVYTVHHTEPAAGGKVRVCLGLDGTVSYALRPDERVPLAEMPTPAAGTPIEFTVEIDQHVQARPRIFEDRFAIYQRGLADPIERFSLPYRSDRNLRTTLAVRGWRVVSDLEYIVGRNCMRGWIEPAPVTYGNAGHWIAACVVDPDAGVPTDAGYAAFGRCGRPLIETTDTPRGHALCVGCTGDPVEMWLLRDRIGWLKDGGRPVKVLRALDMGDRVLMETETIDDKPRDWPVVAAGEIVLGTEEPATRDEIAAGALVEAVVISNRPTRQQWRVDRQPWGDDRSTILSDGRGVVSVYTASLRILEQPEPVNVIDRLDAIVRSAAGVTGPGESPNSQDPLAAVDFGEPRCVHGFYERPEDRTKPVEACKTKQPTASVGVLSDEGCVDQFDCAVQASDEAARMNAEEEHPADDPLYRWAVLCLEHDEQPADSCEDCLAEPDAD
jgi:hypothetical protein